MDSKSEVMKLSINDHVKNSIKQEIEDCKVFQVNHDLHIDQKDEKIFEVQTIKKEFDIQIHIQEIVERNQLCGINSADIKQEPVEEGNTDNDSKSLYDYHIIKEEIVLGPEIIQETADESPHNQRNDISALKQQREEIYKCDCCFKEFTIKSCLEKHICQYSCTNLVTCDNSKKILNTQETPFKSKKNMKNHIKCKQMNYKHTCERCEKKFRLNKSLVQHMKSHNSIENVGRTCIVCGQDFTTSQSLARHLNIVHGGKKPFSCDICNKTYTHKRDFEHHVQKIHSIFKTVTEPIIMTTACEFCKKTFADKSSCSRHENYTCSMNKNKKEKTMKMQLKHMCNICEKTYNHKQSLVKHMKIHLGTLDYYQCDICTKKYRKKDNLQSHIQSKHMNLRLKCDVCKKTFTCQWSLSFHKRTQHDGGLSNKKPLARNGNTHAM